MSISNSSCFTVSSLFSLVRSERMVETYVASVDADGDAGPLLDFLRHGGRCCLSLAMASCLGEKSEVLEKGRPLWCASAKTRDGKKRGLIGWQTSRFSSRASSNSNFSVSEATYRRQSTTYLHALLYLNLLEECCNPSATLSIIERSSRRYTAASAEGSHQGGHVLNQTQPDRDRSTFNSHFSIANHTCSGASQECRTEHGAKMGVIQPFT